MFSCGPPLNFCIKNGDPPHLSINNDRSLISVLQWSCVLWRTNEIRGFKELYTIPEIHVVNASTILQLILFAHDANEFFCPIG